jgi:translation initiation factor 1 (eIF-1/SUI1)
MSDNFDDYESHKTFNQKQKKKVFKAKKYAKKSENINEENINEENINEEVDNLDDSDQDDNNDLKVNTKKNKNLQIKSKFYQNDIESEDSEDSEPESEKEDILMKNKNKKQLKGKNKNVSEKSNTPCSQRSKCTDNLSFPSNSSTPSFISGGDFGFGTNDDFGLTPEEQINNLFENKIHVHKVLRARKANKFDVIISNLNMPDIEIGKALLRKIKVACGIGGSITKNNDVGGDDYVICLNSKDPDRVINFLIDKCGLSEDMIVNHT